MIWDILIITKDYDKYVEYFRNKKEFIDITITKLILSVKKEHSLMTSTLIPSLEI